MELVKNTKNHGIYKKRSGRLAVKDLKSKKYINGPDKVGVLVAEKLLKVPVPKKVEEAPAEEATAPSEESAEAKE